MQFSVEDRVGQSWLKAARAELQAYLATPLPSAATMRQRAWLHLGVGALVTALAFVLNLLPVATTLPALVFCAVCALKTGLTYAVSLYLMDEWVAPFLPGGWGPYSARTVGRVWVIGGAGFLLGFTLLLAQDAYLGQAIPIWLGVSEHRAPTPPLAPWESLLRTVPFAFLIIFLVVHVRLKRQLEWEFAQVAGMNHGPRAPHGHQPDAGSASRSVSGGTQTVATYPKVVLATSAATEAVAPERISHVTIEEHYARVIVLEDGAAREVEVKLPLKKLQALLPPGPFVQVHRSHLVNLAHVDRVERSGTGYHLVLGRQRFVLPVSRSRAQVVLSRLHAFWQES